MFGRSRSDDVGWIDQTARVEELNGIQCPATAVTLIAASILRGLISGVTMSKHCVYYIELTIRAGSFDVSIR
jgi:hypothetical protein